MLFLKEIKICKVELLYSIPKLSIKFILLHLLLLGLLWLYCTVVVQTVCFRPSERREPQDMS